MNQKEDILGKALLDFQNKEELGQLIISGQDLEEDEMDISYYYRNYENMPDLEKVALKHCKGKVLDAGAGAGSHSLYLKEQGLDVSSLDISPGAVEVMKQRGLNDCIVADILSLKDKKYDTILLLMNGIGISAKLNSLPSFIKSLFSLLNDNGQILFDSTDLRYLYMEEDGSMWLDLNADYYGEMNYHYSYKGKRGESFDWLYIDEEKMKSIVSEMGIEMELVYQEDDFHYLARLYKAIL